jgi:hypothetical protein
MTKARQTGKFVFAFWALLLVIVLSGEAYAQAQIKDSLSVTWYESYDGFYDYVHEGPAVSDTGRIVLILAIISTLVVYQLWRRARQRAIQ